jgi:hypothetical protein
VCHVFKRPLRLRSPGVKVLLKGLQSLDGIVRSSFSPLCRWSVLDRSLDCRAQPIQYHLLDGSERSSVQRITRNMRFRFTRSSSFRRNHYVTRQYPYAGFSPNGGTICPFHFRSARLPRGFFGSRLDRLMSRAAAITVAAYPCSTNTLG